jgi:alpha-glucosidase
MTQTDSKAKKKQSEESDDRQPDIIYRRCPSNIAEQHTDGRQLTFRSENNIELRITIHTPEIIQLKYVVEGDQPVDISYALDPDFNPDRPKFELYEKDSHFELKTESLLCRISKKNMHVQFYDQDGTLLCEDKKPFFRRDTLMKGISEVRVTHEAPDGTSYFGLGDKTCKKGLRGNSFENWNTDSYTYERGDDPLYRSIPFYTALNDDGHAYGIFMDNTYRSYFDFDSRKNNTCSFSADGGCMNYFFIYGPELTTISKRYTLLTGTPELPPIWGLGYHQCRWSYYPESRVRKLAEDFRDKKIPCDAIYLDIDYMDNYRVFTWDKEGFSDPAALISDLNEEGFKTIVMIDPGIKVDNDYPIYQQGLKNDYFCKRPDGELMIAPVWPPKTVFPDYTHPEVRDWWAELHEDLISNKGVSGIWNDMNEPAVFEIKKRTFPENIRHHFEGHPASHKKAHNIYGMQMARASFNGIKKHNKGKRPFLLTRANFSGGQRYAALWTGDNIADWDHLKLANEQCQRLSISGYSFVGSDVGGFVDDPSPELFTRWLQLGVFHPLFRNHSMGYNVDGAAAVKKEEIELKKQLLDSDQEPWTFGEKFTDINRSVIELRYRLLHYLYTAFRKYTEEGTPILRPLAFVDQTDKEAISRIDEFIFGDQILVSPVLDKNKRKVETYFPKEQWYDFRNNEIFEGSTTHAVDAPLDKIPFFIKEGTVLPLREVMQYTQERDQQLLELNVYYSESETASQLYEDDGEGYNYVDGNYLHTTFQLKPSTEADKLILTASREGTYTPKYDYIKINVIGLPFKPSSITSDNRKIDFDVDDEVYSIKVGPDFNEIAIT